MAHYLTLYKFNGPIKGGGSERFKVFTGIVEELGGRIVFFGGLLGQYDVVTITDYPALDAAMLGSARIGNLISAQTHTMPIVDQDDFLALLAKTPRQ
jgi:uncharacterized protein with GYD domain